MFEGADHRVRAEAGASVDVLIVGAGLAGLFLALKLVPRHCLVISPSLLGQAASSAWAQGGLAAALDPLTILTVAYTSGVWLFYVQHQFEDTYWQHGEEWDFTAAALQGSSFYKLPKPLQWITGNIGFHHIHHLSSRIPNYYLEACHHSHPLFSETPPITLRSSLKCARLRLFDEKNKRLVGWDYLKELKKADV